MEFLGNALNAFVDLTHLTSRLVDMTNAFASQVALRRPQDQVHSIKSCLLWSQTGRVACHMVNTIVRPPVEMSLLLRILNIDDSMKAWYAPEMSFL